MTNRSTPDFEPDGPFDPRDLVAPQPGAVVSRTILRRPAGTITLFAFDAGEGLSEHSTPHEALIHALTGEAEISIGAATHRVTAGQSLHLPADVPHAVAALSPFRMMLVMLRRPEG